MRTAKKGLAILGCGILGVVISFIPGAGPCGPSTLVGVVVMMLGLLAIPVGAVMLVVGVIAAGR